MASIEGFDPTNDSAKPEDHQAPPGQYMMADRTAPGWAKALGGLFSFAIACCVIGLILLSIFLHHLVIETGESRMSFVLLGVACALAAAIAVLEFAQVKALTGFRKLREFQSMKVNAILGILLGLLVLFIDPIAGLITPVATGIGLLGLWWVSNQDQTEAHWVFEPSEVTSLLSGRDANAMTDVNTRPVNHALAPAIRKTCFWFAIGAGVAVGTYLVSEQILMPGVVIALTLVSAWSVDSILRFYDAGRKSSLTTATVQSKLPVVDVDGNDPSAGLTIEALNVQDISGKKLLANVSMQAYPGEIVGIIGESGAGKSLLLQAIADPLSLQGTLATGALTYNGQNLWSRSASVRKPTLVLSPDHPIILPATGDDNLSCFQGGDQLERGQFFLEQLVFARDVVHEICQTKDARTLPSMHQKALAIARAFAMAPQVYLFDRPEDALQTAQISAFCNRLENEARLRFHP